MTPKEKARKYFKDKLLGRVNLTWGHVWRMSEETIDIALQEQAKEISEDIINYIKQKYLHNPVRK